MANKKLIIGSRDSHLALIQSYWVKTQLESVNTDIEIIIKRVKTQGDKVLDVALSKIGDKGLFVKELENELLNNSIDLAVHSMKDLPTTLPDGLEIAVTSIREDVRDVLCLSKHAHERGIKTMAEAKVIGTSSLRRIAQLKAKYPHIEFKDIRGNLHTRFSKLDDPGNGFDGIILAAAGIHRFPGESLGSSLDGFLELLTEDQKQIFDQAVITPQRISEYLDPSEVLPAVGQGALAIEISSARADIRELIRSLNSVKDELVVKGERAFLRKLEGGCSVPIGIYSELISDSEVKYTGLVASVDGKEIVKSDTSGAINDSESLGVSLAETLIELGAARVLASIR